MSAMRDALVKAGKIPTVDYPYCNRAGIDQCFGWHEYDSKFFKLDESS